MVGGPVFSWRFWPYFRLALTPALAKLHSAWQKRRDSSHTARGTWTTLLDSYAIS
jgi:hypothetical protein